MQYKIICRSAWFHNEVFCHHYASTHLKYMPDRVVWLTSIHILFCVGLHLCQRKISTSMGWRPIPLGLWRLCCFAHKQGRCVHLSWLFGFVFLTMKLWHKRWRTARQQALSFDLGIEGISTIQTMCNVVQLGLPASAPMMMRQWQMRELDCFADDEND